MRGTQARGARVLGEPGVRVQCGEAARQPGAQRAGGGARFPFFTLSLPSGLVEEREAHVLVLLRLGGLGRGLACHV
jgi:hypothetical protein